jgi:hypothetical protein
MADVEFQVCVKKNHDSMRIFKNGSMETFNRKKDAEIKDRMQDWTSPMDGYHVQHSREIMHLRFFDALIWKCGPDAFSREGSKRQNARG